MNERLRTVTEKIPREVTGLAGALYVHVNYTRDDKLRSIRFSFKGKDNSTLDNILVALSDKVSQIIKDISV